METFLRGQIQPKYRGNLPALVTKRDAPGGVGVFLYPIDSEEFDHITGVGSVNHPLERAYIGLNQQGGELIARTGDSVDREEVDFEVLDKMVVNQYFLQ